MTIPLCAWNSPTSGTGVAPPSGLRYLELLRECLACVPVILALPQGVGGPHG